MQKVKIYTDLSIDNGVLQNISKILHIDKIDLGVFSGDGLVYEKDSLRFVVDLKDLDKPKKGVRFDWSSQISYHKQRNYALRKEPLAKALGLRGDSVSHVWDATCGTGKDSLLIHSFGARVSAFERVPTVACLILQEALANEAVLDNRFKFHYGTMIDVFNKGEVELPDVIYFDPMFPDEGRKKSALPRKEMQIFKTIVGSDEDSGDFLTWALQQKVKRVVVKRHPGSPFLKKNPTASFESKSVRYDMYSLI